MCDLRQPPKQIKNNETQEVYDVSYHGFIGLNLSRADSSGIYMIGATGVGYSYYDGKEWQGGYGEKGKYTMIFPENSEGSPCLHQLQDVKDIIFPNLNTPTGSSCLPVEYLITPIKEVPSYCTNSIEQLFPLKLEWNIPVSGDCTESLEWQGCCGKGRIWHNPYINGSG